MPTTLTLFEHETKLFDLTERDLRLLEKINTSVGAEILRPTFRSRNRAIQASQHVGLVRLRNRTIQILPKIYKSSAEETDEHGRKAATRNLLYMLETAGYLSTREYALAPFSESRADWFEILTRLFTEHLLDEWQRGAYRTYQIFEQTLPVLKGKWLISSQLKRPGSGHIFDVTYDEFTADNKLNHLFRFTVERLWQLSQDKVNHQRLTELRHWMDEVTLLPRMTAADADPAQLTRLNERFRPLLNLARLFLDGGTLQMVAGDISSFAFVFDMNQLFEAFVANTIRRYRHDILGEQLADCDVLIQSRSANLFLAYYGTRQVFQVRPDLVVRRNRTEFPLLIDTKYKRLNSDDLKLGISHADFYQMHAYAHRYDSPRVVLIYPQIQGMSQPLRARFPLHSSMKMIEAATVDLRIDMRNHEHRKGLSNELKSIIERATHDPERSGVPEVTRQLRPIR